MMGVWWWWSVGLKQRRDIPSIQPTTHPTKVSKYTQPHQQEDIITPTLAHHTRLPLPTTHHPPTPIPPKPHDTSVNGIKALSLYLLSYSFWPKKNKAKLINYRGRRDSARGGPQGID